VNSCFNFSANTDDDDDDEDDDGSVTVAAVMALVRNMYLLVENHVCRLRCYGNDVPSDGVRMLYNVV
jgi:hypothetical protein